MDAEMLEPFTEHVRREGSPRWFPLSTDANGVIAFNLPASWRDAAVSSGSKRAIIRKIWGGVATTLPRTYTLILDRVVDISILATDRNPSSLVYFFRNADQIIARRGYAPLTAMPAIAAKFSEDLFPFYSMHNGWVNFFSDDGGLLRVTDWESFPNADGADPGFVKVASLGSNAFGWDVSSSPPECYTLWPDDDDVERVDEPWSELDGWMSASIKNMDPA